MEHKTGNTFNPFPHDKILDQTKLKAFADDKLHVTKRIITVFDRVENIVEKGEIACTSNFSFSHNIFKRLLSQTRQNVSLCGNGLRKVDEYVSRMFTDHSQTIVCITIMIVCILKVTYFLIY